MLTQLSTVKARLGIDDFNVASDALLTNAINAVSARFDHECNRVLGRRVDAIEEFDADRTEIIPAGYPIESVSKFETKTNESEGWIEQTGVEYLIRRQCIVSLPSPISFLRSPLPLARITYTGGYLLPGSADVPSATRLPDDLEQAAVEQVVYWYQNRDRVGVIREWPKGGVYEQFLDIDLLPGVREVLRMHRRIEF